jgi:hypothetical protein
VAFFLACSLGNVRIYDRYVVKIIEGGSPMYLPPAELNAMYWLDHAAPDNAVVFLSYATGNYLPRIAGNPVFVGEDMLTEAADVREKEVAAFFGRDWTDQQRADLLHRFGVDYVFYGPDEQKLGTYAPRNAPFLRKRVRRRRRRNLQGQERGLAAVLSTGRIVAASRLTKPLF